VMAAQVLNSTDGTGDYSLCLQLAECNAMA
jgi:hypothetical protein